MEFFHGKTRALGALLNQVFENGSGYVVWEGTTDEMIKVSGLW